MSIEENKLLSSHASARQVLVGSFLGLAWGAALRAWMVLLAIELGETPELTWAGTFGAILFPAALVGGLLGASMHDAEFPDRKRWRWVILSPLLLIIGPVLVTKNFFTILITTGMGGGSIGVALIGVFGGYTFSGMGARWTRWLAGFLAAGLTIGSIFPVYFADPASAAPPGPRKVFGMLLFIVLMALMVVGVSAPFRRAKER